MVVAHLESGATGIQPIQKQADRQARETGFETFGQAIEGFQFAVLLVGGELGVFDKFGHQREGEPVGRHQLGFQHRMVIEGCPVLEGLGQTVGAVSFSKSEYPGAIDGHQIVQPQQPVAGEHFLADQDLHTAADDFLDFSHGQALKAVVERIAMRNALHPKPGGKFGGGGAIASQAIIQPTPRAQVTNEEEDAHK